MNSIKGQIVWIDFGFNEHKLPFGWKWKQSSDRIWLRRARARVQSGFLGFLRSFMPRKMYSFKMSRSSHDFQVGDWVECELNEKGKVVVVRHTLCPYCEKLTSGQWVTPIVT